MEDFEVLLFRFREDEDVIQVAIAIGEAVQDRGHHPLETLG